MLFPCVNADTSSVNVDLMFLYSGCTALPHVLKHRIGYKRFMDSDFCQAKQFQDERLFGVKKEFTRNGRGIIYKKVLGLGIQEFWG